MLGPQLLASQTYRLLGYTMRRVGKFRLRRGGAWSCIFCGLRLYLQSRRVSSGPKVMVSPLRKFTSKYPNAFLPVPCLLSIGVPSFFPWELQSPFPGEEFA